MKVAGGQSEDGVVIGNTYDKYNSRNPIVKWVMAGFENTLSELVIDTDPTTIHDIGCGEGYWVMTCLAKGRQVKGSDFSTEIIKLARTNAAQCGYSPDLFQVRSIYDLEPSTDKADLVTCCEVLEHIEDPERGLEALQRVVERDLILSVPREPLWRLLNMARGKYLSDLGNTPGHINHWSTASFCDLVSQYFDIATKMTPLPWTMLHCKPKT